MYCVSIYTVGAKGVFFFNEILFHSGHNPVRCTEYSYNFVQENIYCV